MTLGLDKITQTSVERKNFGPDNTHSHQPYHNDNQKKKNY